MGIGFCALQRIKGYAFIGEGHADAFGVMRFQQPAHRAARLSAVDVDVLNQTISALEGAADSLAAVDVDGLNTAVASLGKAADTLKDLDINSLNGIISSLDQAIESLNRVSETLKTAVDGIKGIFG